MNNCDNKFPPFIPFEDCTPCKPCYTVEEQICKLNEKVDVCISTYNIVMKECYKTLNNLVATGEQNSAYYGPCEVWTEQGYDSESGANYTIIRKSQLDKHKKPIRMKLKLAYNNTTNSQIKESIFNASSITYADKIISAIPVTNAGWYGLTIYEGAPIPSNTSATYTPYFTVGFNDKGVMRAYPNSATIETLQNDGIVNSMGCSGVIINNGEITSGNWITSIPNKDQKSARVAMGYNNTTNEVIILTVGQSDSASNDGMTTAAVANVLLGYGCNLAVEICEGIDACALDKGKPIFQFNNEEVPQLYAYWYITKSADYKDTYTRNLAELTQNYGQLFWECSNVQKKISDITNEIANITEEVQDAGTNADTALTQASQALSKVNALEIEVNTYSQRISTLETNYTSLQSTVSSNTSMLNSILDGTADIPYIKTTGDTTIKGQLDIENTTATETVSIQPTVIEFTTPGTISNLDKRLANIQSDEAMCWDLYSNIYSNFSGSVNTFCCFMPSGIFVCVNETLTSTQPLLLTFDSAASKLQQLVSKIPNVVYANKNYTFMVPVFVTGCTDKQDLMNVQVTINPTTLRFNLTARGGGWPSSGNIIANFFVALPITIQNG